MKRVLSYLFLICICNIVFAKTNIIFSNNQTLEIDYDTESPDICIRSIKGKLVDSYRIESIGPDCKIVSMFTDSVNNKNILITEIYLGDPGGRQSLDLRNLYVFEISKDGKIRLVVEEEVVNICYSVAAKDFTSLKRYLYIYNHESKNLVIYDIKNYEFIEYKKIMLKEMIN